MTSYDFASAFDLTGKVVVVTGAAGGIGQAMVRAFVERGAKIALVDRAAQTQSLAEKLGPPHRAWTFDIGDEAAIATFATECEAHFGRIDILINNAGIGILAPAEDLPVDAWDITMTVNLRAPYLFDAGFANCASCIGESGTMSVSDIHRADEWDMLRCLAFELLDSLDRDAVRLGVQDEIRRAVAPEFHVLRTMQVYPRDRGTAGGPRGARATTTMTGRVPG